MKIAKIEQFFPRHRMRLVRITTDNGLVGWGERNYLLSTVIDFPSSDDISGFNC